MDFVLTPVDVRILGALIEKQATTPDVYPMTLNGLLTACNQKSNREPVMNLTETELQEGLDRLIEKTLASTWQANRNRTIKYQHRLHQRAFDEFNFTTPELAVLAALFLRGPQTLGEIRARCARIHEFPDIDSVVGVLEDLEANDYGPYVTRLAREPGRKEHRYMHLFCGRLEAGTDHGTDAAPETMRKPTAVSDVEAAVSSSTDAGWGSPQATGPRSREAAPAGTRSGQADGARIAALEQEIRDLNDRLAALENRLEAFVKQFD